MSSGPFLYDNNDKLRFIGGTGITVTAVDRLSGPAINISSDINLGRSVRYRAPGFTGQTNSSCFVRSYILNNISVVRSGPLVISPSVVSGRQYTFTIPSNDEICHFTLTDRYVDGSSNNVLRITFVWSDPLAEWNTISSKLAFPIFVVQSANNLAQPQVNGLLSLGRIAASLSNGVQIFPNVVVGPSQIDFNFILNNSGLNRWYIISGTF